jgi:transposase-like protein
MSEALITALSGIRTVEDMTGVFGDEERCRRLLEAMVWPNGRVCPACGYRHSVALAGRDIGKFRARPGLYQCSNGDCRFQFTVTTRTPLHSTKLPLGIWLKAMWLILQSDKGLSSVRLAEAVGVSQPTAWRMGHALRLMVTRENALGGTVEIDERSTEEEDRRAAARSWSQGPAQDNENPGVDRCAKTQCRDDWLVGG